MDTTVAKPTDPFRFMADALRVRYYATDPNRGDPGDVELAGAIDALCDVLERLSPHEVLPAFQAAYEQGDAKTPKDVLGAVVMAVIGKLRDGF